MADTKMIVTVHPVRKRGIRMTQNDYSKIRAFIFSVLKSQNEIRFDTLLDLAEQELKSEFNERLAWYLLHVKIDLQTRGFVKMVVKNGHDKWPTLKARSKYFAKELACYIESKT